MNAMDMEMNAGISTRDLSIKSGTSVEENSDFITAIISLASNSFGVSCLALTGYFASSSFLFFVFALFFSAFMNYYSSSCFAYFAETKKLSIFSDFSRKCCPKYLKTANDIFYFCFNYGALIVSLVFVNNFVCQVMQQFTSIELFTKPGLLFWLFFTSFISFPIVMKRQLKEISFVTVLSLVAMFGLFALVFAHLLNSSKSSEAPVADGSIRKPHSQLSIIFYTLYILSYQANIIGIYDEMKFKSLNKMRNILFIHSALFVSFYSFIAISGFLIFQSSENLYKSDLLTLFPQNGLFVIIIKFLMICTSFVSFVCAFKPVKETLIDRVIAPKNHSENESRDLDREYFEARKVVFAVTLITLISVTLLSGILLKSGIDFIGIIDFMALMIAPVVCLIIPIYLYAAESKSSTSKIVLMLSILLYIGGFINWFS